MTDTPVRKTSRKSKSSKKYSPSYVKEVLNDYRLCCLSREVSILGRKEVLTGKAKFGILGDGKELAQVALSHYFKKGDWRSGYYRDQTWMFALGISKVEDFFAQLYADQENDPFSGGRQMNAHFATATIDDAGNWVDVTNTYNVSSDISSTAGQMGRGLGLALASKIYRNDKRLSAKAKKFTKNGDEVVVVTIGDASTSEGVFWETLNAAAVQTVPMVICVWDDGYGISVPKNLQTTKSSISAAAAGFQKEKGTNGMEIYNVKAWDYVGLRETYKKAIDKTRKSHVPCLIHVEEVTQPQGHSTSGSHERYKSKERLQWEKDFDGLKKMREWLISEGIATDKKLATIEQEAIKEARDCKRNAWDNYNKKVDATATHLESIYKDLVAEQPDNQGVKDHYTKFKNLITPTYAEIIENARRLSFSLIGNEKAGVATLKNWLDQEVNNSIAAYAKHLLDEGENGALQVPMAAPVFNDESKTVNGYQVLNANFDKLLESNPYIHAFGEDVGGIGGVNQGFMGMQQKHGVNRVFDTGIRELTIMGQAIGMAMRGLRPIAEIQYLDYLIYGLQPLVDDLTTIRWRSNGLQIAPAIIRTRGHRLEGIWHAGSPMGMMVNSLRGMHVCVPRNMTQAAGMYNTLLKSHDPGIVVECLNGYRLKEKQPENLGEFTVPLGMVETLQEGTDLTLITYGSCIRVAQKAVEMLSQKGISVELIDIQTLLPFDLEHQIVESLKKTNRIVFLDEDVPGGATAYMLQKVMEEQNGYRFLDSQPLTITAAAHRPPYGSDGDYFGKPNAEDVFEKIYGLMREVAPHRFG